MLLVTQQYQKIGITKCVLSKQAFLGHEDRKDILFL